MVVRVLAYCLEYEEGITTATEGVSSGDEPACLVRDLTGRVTAWIEVVCADAQRLPRQQARRPGWPSIRTATRDSCSRSSPARRSIARATSRSALRTPSAGRSPRAIDRRTSLSLSGHARRGSTSRSASGTFTLPIVEHRVSVNLESRDGSAVRPSESWNEVIDIFLDRCAPTAARLFALHDAGRCAHPTSSRRRCSMTRDGRSERLPQLHLEGDGIEILAPEPSRRSRPRRCTAWPRWDFRSATRTRRHHLPGGVCDLRLNRRLRQSVTFERLLEALHWPPRRPAEPRSVSRPVAMNICADAVAGVPAIRTNAAMIAVHACAMNGIRIPRRVVYSLPPTCMPAADVRFSRGWPRQAPSHSSRTS